MKIHTVTDLYRVERLYQFLGDEVKGWNGLRIEPVVIQPHRHGKGEKRRSYTDHYPVAAILWLERER